MASKKRKDKQNQPQPNQPQQPQQPSQPSEPPHKRWVEFGKKTIQGAGSAASAAGSTVASAAKAVAPSNLTIAAIIAIISAVIDLTVGAGIGSLAIVINLVIFGLYLILGFSAKTAIIPALLETFSPSILSFLPFINLTLAGYLTIIPFWGLYCIWYSLKHRGEGSKSKLVDIFSIVLILAIAISLIPSVANSIPAPGYVKNQIAIDQAKEQVTELIDSGITETKSQWTFFLCTAKGNDNKACTKLAYPEKENLNRILVVNPILDNYIFKIDITNFISDGKTIPTNNVFTNYVPITTTLDGVYLSYGCGFVGFPNSGKTEPSSYVTSGSVAFSGAQNSIMCTVDKSKTTKRLPTYYFNVTATDVISEGKKEILLLGASEKTRAIKAQMKEAGDVDITLQSVENSLLETSEYGDLILARKKANLFSPAVGKNDVVQTIIQDGFTDEVGTEFPLIYGVGDGTRADFTDFAIFVKNIGKGRIISIKDVRFTLPSDIEFSTPNCGMTPEQLASETYNVAPNAYHSLGSCRLVFKGDLKNPSQYETRTISVKLVYDYMIHKEAQVSKS